MTPVEPTFLGEAIPACTLLSIVGGSFSYMASDVAVLAVAGAVVGTVVGLVLAAK